jgi:hypothetical protein
LVAHADVGGFIEGGLSRVSAEETDPPFRAELDDGTGLNIAGGIRWAPGFMVKASYSMSEHDGGDLFQNGRRLGSFDDEVTAEELRIGFYWAPLHETTIGYRVGGGYENTMIDIATLGDNETDGFFVEGALLIKAGQVVTFDLGGAIMATEDDDSNDTDGLELHVGAKFHAGPVDIGAMYRHIEFTTDAGGVDVDDEFGEFRVTIGGSWGYGRR